MKNYYTKWNNHSYSTPYTGNKKNILVIGDLHMPFTHKQYLQFCRYQQEKYDCGTVIFIGDLLDNHFSSFHDTDPDGLSAGDEAILAKEQLKEWFFMFPKAIVCVGNHDLIIYRKMFSNGISRQYAQNWNQLFNAPKNWSFVDQIIINDILYKHGSSKALKAMNDSRISIVQGHLHSEFYIQYSQSEKDMLFAMQCGCGIDEQSFAFGYAKNFGKKPVLGCGVILDSGKLPILIPM